MVMQSIGGVITEQFLELSQERLLLADTTTGRDLALEALLRSSKDSHRQAQAYLILARLDILDSKLSRAAQFAKLAADGFGDTQDPVSQASALSAFGYAASALKNDALSIEAIRRGQTLVDGHGKALARADCLNYLGLAHMWAGDQEQSHRALNDSLWFALEANRGQFQPLVNICIAEVMAHHHSVHVLKDGQGDLDSLFSVTRHCDVVRRAGVPAVLNKGTTGAGLTALLEFALAYCCAQRKDFGQAMLHIRACRESVTRWSPSTWLKALAWWARIEVAIAQRQWQQALQCCWAMKSAAIAGEQRHLQDVATRLKLHVERHLFGSDSEL